MNTPVKRSESVANSMLTIIATAAANPEVDVAKMTALLELQERLLEREARTEFTQALSRMNSAGDLRVSKHGEVRLTKGGPVTYKFATWPDMDAVIRPLMQMHGFTLSFDTEIRSNGVVIKGELLHEGGHARTASLPLPIDKGAGRNDLQAMGSTISYGKRYVTEMLLNIVRDSDEDDDGNGGRRTLEGERAREGGRAEPTPELPTAREKINEEVVVTPPKPTRQQQIDDWLNRLESELNEAASLGVEMVEKVAERKDVVEAKAKATGANQQALTNILANALEAAQRNELEQAVAAVEGEQ